jgi:release factor glutamine methyltransferase
MMLNMTVAILLEEGVARLRHAAALGACSPAARRLDAELLLAHALALPRARLRSHPEAAAGAGVARQYRELLERRAAGEPVAYLTGEKEFWALPLKLSAAVLVPRPETELLVERALALVRHDRARAVDLGTGSGAIALALASERPNWQLLATDVSEAALGIARANARALALERVQFRRGSWLAPLGADRFDLIVSNPPYVAADDPALAALQHEPRLALTPGNDALLALREIIHGAPAHLLPGGWLLLEHGATQGAAVRRELALAGMRYIRSHPDLAGLERATEGQLNDQI